MQTIQTLAYGKLKEKYLRDAAAEYEKRLSRYCTFKCIELEPIKLSENASEKEIAAALEKEGQQLLKRMKGYVIAMCIEGKLIDSVALSEKIQSVGLSGDSTITFVIGSSYGLSDEVKRMADLKLSMSPMTFPHQLARVMLYEQIYRSYQIQTGSKYHK